jgi:predicted ATP-binding protein involved in virulence
MNSFKIIALRTLGKCYIDGKDIYKTLAAETIYPFFNEYSYPKNSFEKIKLKNIDSINFYKSEKGPSININAIVGSNGSGKSTLIELLLIANYNLGAFFQLLEKCTCEEKAEDQNEPCNCHDEKNIEKLVPLKEFQLEILYISTEGEPFVLRFEYGKISKCSFKDNPDGSFDVSDEVNLTREDLENFCYSIVINYSQHSLNSLETGNWIISLFHKNDGYQTPIVINPMRDEGNIDINRENELLNNRLLSNILEPVKKGKEGDSLRNIANGKIAKSITFTFDHYKTLKSEGLSYETFTEWGIAGAREVAMESYEGYLSNKENIDAFKLMFNLDLESLDSKNDYVIFGLNYIYTKLYSITSKYKNYKNLKEGPPYESKFGKVIHYLIEDHSHIAFKIKQAIFFLKYLSDWEKILLNLNTPIPIEDISTLITELKKKENKASKSEEIELLPPSFLKVKINLSDGLSFDSLSSGEKQKIHSVSSIVYHIINLNSVKKNNKSINIENKNQLPQLKYKNINIILDEIELYYHPEWQRRFIADLLSYLKKINSKYTASIKTLNFSFITHSPFILSDIPKSNVLFLERKNIDDSQSKSVPVIPSKMENTLGANIHELLTNGFFMQSTTGEYTRQKIKEVIDFHYKVKLSSVENIGELKKEFEIKKIMFEFLTQNIGEEFIQGMLENHLDFIREKLSIHDNY